MTRIICALALGLLACRSSTSIQLPGTGLAHAADGRVAFVRETPDRLIATSLGDVQATELWIANADGTHARRIVAGTASDSAEHTLAAMSSPQFSPDGRRVYFLSRAWVTSDAVHAVDLSTNREWFVAPGNSLDVIERGPLSGCLLVSQHRYRPTQDGAYDWTWLLATDGHEIAVADSDSAGSDRRLEAWKAGTIPDESLRTSLPAQSYERCGG